jgi:hypothetical protein
MEPQIVPDEAPALQDSASKYLNFGEHKTFLKRIIDDWSSEIEGTKVRRKTRKLEIDVEALRASNEIDQDETFIPVRVIDTNIQREQPPYINYLKNSRRLTTMRCLSRIGLDTQKLEEEFTAGMTYEGWETPHFKCLDGAQTHGWDCVEVVYDESKPLHVALEHVGHDKLYFPRSTINLQDCPRVIRRYDVTREVLNKFVTDFGFDKTVVDALIAKDKNTQKEDDTLPIYKVSFKMQRIVYVAWFSLETNTSDWLKAPAKAYIGIDRKVTETVEIPTSQFDILGNPIMQQQTIEKFVPADITVFPYFILPYRESEEAELMERQGRVELDESKQEASTAILSGFVNRLNRASRVYGSPDTEDGAGKLKELSDLKLHNSSIVNKPFRFWSLDYPDPMVLNALQFLDVQNAQETNQVAFAVNNRKDSRKTAKEISSAEQKESLLNSVQLTLFSTYIRSIYSLCWLIVQSQALQQKIPLLQQETKMLDGSISYKNSLEVIAQTYEVRAAGDVDVVQRQEKLQQMMQDWPVVAQTPLKYQFLADMLKLKYPDVGEKYAAAIAQAPVVEQMQGQVMALGSVLKGVLQQYPQIAQSLPPQQLQQLNQILATVPTPNNESSQNIPTGIGQK